jgi:hypothetical protein
MRRRRPRTLLRRRRSSRTSAARPRRRSRISNTIRASAALSPLRRRSSSGVRGGGHDAGSMDGLKLAHAVRDRWPPIKIIVVSGRMEVTQNELPTNSRFFAKPFHAEKMIKELQAFVQS